MRRHGAGGGGDRAAAARAAARYGVALLAAVTVGCAPESSPGGEEAATRAPVTAASSPSRAADTTRVTPWPDAVPLVDTLPDDVHGRLARRGRAILAATRDSLPDYVGNGLRCTSCHLEDGRRRDALPWVGVLARFPQYRTRNAMINQITDRVNDCFERSLAGRPLPVNSDAMRAIVAYFGVLSRGVPHGTSLAGQASPRLTFDAPPDPVAGAAIYVATCARCHGPDGEGTSIAPAVWGAQSYSIGAGMGRPRTAAAFIRANMPYDQPRGTPTLSPQQAYDVAAYINAQPRPDFARKDGDWPFGGAPPDVPYRTIRRDSTPRD